MSPQDSAYRLRLEGKAELLDRARLRYRAFEKVLSSLTWRRKLRRNEALLDALSAEATKVYEALTVVEHRSRVEAWEPKSETVRCARDVRKLEQTVHRLMGRRLKDAKQLDFMGRLAALKQQLVPPRRVPPHERWSAALEALPARLPEVQELAKFGAQLESLFSRPAALSASEVEALLVGWNAGEAALSAAWARVAAVDTTDGTVRALKRRSRRAPMKRPLSGPELLLRTEFWKTLALVRLREVAEAQLSPVQLTETELIPAVHWLSGGPLRIEGVRGDLLSWVSKLRKVKELNADEWSAFEEQARVLERELKSDADLARVRDSLRLAVRVRASRNRRPLDPLPRRREEPTRLADLVSELR